MSITAMKLIRDAIERGDDLTVIGAKHILDQAIAEAELPTQEELTALYTHPQPKREWVGLTDQEYLLLIDQIDDACGIDLIEYGQAVIAKWKEKNT